MEGEIIATGGIGDNTKNEEGFFLQILEAENGFIHPILLVSPPLQYVAIAVIILLFLIGSYFKSVLYIYLFEKKEVNEIDWLILTPSIIQHTVQGFNVVSNFLLSILRTALGQADG